MSSMMRRAFGVLTMVVLLVSLSLLPLGCGDDDNGGGGGGGGGSSGYSELLVVSDGATLRSFSVSGANTTERGSAAIPGIPGTYSRLGTLVTVTIQNHDLPETGFWVDLVFSAGTGGTATSGKYQATIIDDDTFTITDTASGSISGGSVYRKPTTSHTGTYSQPNTTITVTVPDHNLYTGDIVRLLFTSGTATNTTKRIASVIDADTFTVTADSAATTSGNVTVVVGGNYTIFGVSMHPSGKWLYTASTYECWTGSPFCWDNGLISRFGINWTTGALTFQKTVQNRPSCSAPVTINFSPDGSRLFDQDDCLDGIQMWSVDASTGDLNFLDEAGGAHLHGVGVSADGSRVYNGDNVYSVSSTTLALTHIGVGCNSSIIRGSTLFCADYRTGWPNWEINTFSLTDPDAPSLIASMPTYTQQGRVLAVSADGARIVSAGWGGLKSFDYNGAVITPAAASGSNEWVDGGGAWPGSGVRKMFRGVSMNKSGSMLSAAYFTFNSSIGPQGVPPSGYMLFTLAADGSLSLAQDYANNYYTRAAVFFSKP